MSAALRISLIYLLLASAWIWLSDSFAHLLPIPAGWSADVQTLKGELFVVLTAALLFWLIRKEERRQHELQMELRQTRARLEHFVDVSPAVIYVFEAQDAGPRLKLSYLSANIERLTGFTTAEFYQQPALALDRLHPEDQAPLRAQLRRAVNDGTELCLQYRWRHRDGQYRWIEDRATLNRNPVTGKAELVGNWRDISQAKQDELLLQAAEERWRFAIDGSEIGLWDWNVPDKTVFFSTRWKTMLGHEDSEVGNALSEWSSRVHPDDLPAVQADVQRLLTTPDAPYSNEHRVRCKDGSYIWILDRGKVVERNERGEAVRVIGTHTDLSALKQREAALDLHAGMFMNSLEGIVICGPDQRIESVNRTFSDITGYTAEEAVGHPPSFLSSGRHDADFYRQMWQQIEQTGRWQGEIWNRRKSGELYIEWLTINVDHAPDGSVRHYYAIFSDISERKATEEKIRHISQHDTLTNLPNQSVLRDRLGLALAHAQRSQEPLAVLFMDLDRFKIINDSLGPTAADALLVEVAHRLTQTVRHQDTVSRQGGDEFTLLLPEVDAADAAHVAQKLLTCFAEPFHVSGQQLVVTPSIGIAVYPTDGHEVDTLLQASDMAMYRAKSDGGNTFRFHTADMHQRVSKTLRLENDLRKALRQGELLLHFQPQVSFTTGRVVGCEALVRWQHPETGLMPPAEFIPVAEDSGLIVPIGDWVLYAATRQCRAWQLAGLQDLVVAINVSTVQFRQEDFAQSVQHALTAANLEPRFLEVEITESVMADNPERAIRTIRQLHDLGVQLSIDDFGTGYSSFSYLKRFKIHKLKIDQSFVRDLNTDGNSASIAQAIISMAHSLGLSVIAEGVETPDQAQWLATHHCDEAQGYLYARPMPVDQFETWLGQFKAR
ncbi:MAG: EAL domain-containing protein [Aquabacterium sp.]|jgi:diguanylate cyclase (GGDEF)-like protein/PAS domain S-box-containing protein|uniref:sensor domain-containing protein n=1 Tax=Aquabacterium sp. TaxID=1872578 RepID=UPI002A36DCBF|nr:EAL domain-containing protein [Aquabacterium sp.]MDX9843909.1 EAL domain-containing protein [Aquabacterium sp.]